MARSIEFAVKERQKSRITVQMHQKNDDYLKLLTYTLFSMYMPYCLLFCHYSSYLHNNAYSGYTVQGLISAKHRFLSPAVISTTIIYIEPFQ